MGTFARRLRHRWIRHRWRRLRASTDSAALISPAAIVNLLGDVWLNGTPDYAAALRVPGVRLHLYEKHKPRKGRKMGHLSAVGKTPDEAVQRVLTAKELL